MFKNFSELDGRPQVEEPVPMAGCGPDFGWNDGADGSGKCYRVIKNADYTSGLLFNIHAGYALQCVYRSCGVDLYETGMSWFTAMECCYFNKGYLAEPQNEDEQAKIVEYITAGGC